MPACTFMFQNCWHRVMGWGCTCHISKGGYKLEEWRQLLARSHEIVAREKSIFRAGVRFGVIRVTDDPVVFHFERPELAAESR